MLLIGFDFIPINVASHVFDVTPGLYYLAAEATARHMNVVYFNTIEYYS